MARQLVGLTGDAWRTALVALGKWCLNDTANPPGRSRSRSGSKSHKRITAETEHASLIDIRVAKLHREPATALSSISRNIS